MEKFFSLETFTHVIICQLTYLDAEYAMKKYSYYYLKKNGKDVSLQRSVRILQNLNHKCTFTITKKGILKFITYIITNDDSIYLMFEPCKKGSLESVKNVIIESG